MSQSNETLFQEIYAELLRNELVPLTKDLTHARAKRHTVLHIRSPFVKLPHLVKQPIPDSIRTPVREEELPQCLVVPCIWTDDQIQTFIKQLRRAVTEEDIKELDKLARAFYIHHHEEPAH